MIVAGRLANCSTLIQAGRTLGLNHWIARSNAPGEPNQTQARPSGRHVCSCRGDRGEAVPARSRRSAAGGCGRRPAHRGGPSAGPGGQTSRSRDPPRPRRRAEASDRRRDQAHVWTRRAAALTSSHWSVPAWNNARILATGKPHPAAWPPGCPKCRRSSGVSGIENDEPSRQRERSDAHAGGRRSRSMVPGRGSRT